jgi:hypothetical protein
VLDESNERSVAEADSAFERRLTGIRFDGLVLIALPASMRRVTSSRRAGERGRAAMPRPLRHSGARR